MFSPGFLFSCNEPVISANPVLSVSTRYVPPGPVPKDHAFTILPEHRVEIIPHDLFLRRGCAVQAQPELVYDLFCIGVP